MKASIGVNNKEIALSELVVVPPFLRFDTVWLEYRFGFQSIAQKCDTFRDYLLSIKASLNDSNITKFYCKIHEEDPSQFNNHLTFLEHIREIVSICKSSHGYAFLMNSDALDDVVSSTFAMPEIARSSFAYFLPHSTRHLPIEAISNWLNRERNAMGQNQRTRTLTLGCLLQEGNIQIQEMCDFLKQVSFLFPNI